MRAPISYYGGKQRIASKIVKLIPKHTVYVEPFAGGAAVMFAKPWPDVTNADHYREVINDIDRRLMNFYAQLRDNGDALRNALALTQHSEAEYATAKRLDEGDELERARRYFVNIQQSFAHKLSAGWRRAVYNENDGATWAKKVAGLPEFIERMSSVYVSSTDVLKCIAQWDSPQTFFYVDPPYPGTNQGHYAGYTAADFAALVEALDACDGSFILSCYDFDGLNVPDNWERATISTNMSAHGRVGCDRSKKHNETSQNRKRTEVLFRRAARVTVRSEIQKLYDKGAFDCFEGVKITTIKENEKMKVTIEIDTHDQIVRFLEFISGQFNEAPDAPAIAEPAAVTLPPPPLAEAEPTSNADLDSKGMPYDARIHARTRVINKDGSWRQKRGVDPALVASVEAELKGAATPPPPPAAAATPPPPAEADPATFPEFMKWVVKQDAVFTDTDGLNKLCGTIGLPSIGLLATQPDKIPTLVDIVKNGGGR